MNRKSIALDAYETLAESYAVRVDTAPHNAHYERPATLSLLPEVKGKRVLDAGCGPGVYAEWLVNHGAEVVAFDVSPKMVQFARERLGSRAKVIQADLCQPLDFLEDSSFDIVLSALALDYVKDWDETFQEFYKVLCEPGVLVFSVCHPFAEFILRGRGSYFETELVSCEWGGLSAPVNVPSYRRPLGALIAPLLEAGFALERILEPIPTERFRQEAPQDYEELCRRPGFMCVRAAKTGKPETGAA